MGFGSGFWDWLFGFGLRLRGLELSLGLGGFVFSGCVTLGGAGEMLGCHG